MIDGSLLLYAFAPMGRGRRAAWRVRVLELGAIGRRHYSHRLRLPHGPIGLFSSSPSSPSSTSLPHAITTARFCPSLFPLSFGSSLPLALRRSIFLFASSILLFLPSSFASLFPSGSDFQARDLTAVSYLLRARILFGAPFNYLVRNSNEEEQLLY